MWNLFKKTNGVIFLITLFYTNINLNAQSTNWSINFDSELSFVENKGQFNNRNWQTTPVEFAVHRGKLSAFFTKKGLTYRFDKFVRNPKRKEHGIVDTTVGKYTNVSELIHMTWIGSNPNVQILAYEPLNSYSSISYIDYNDNEKVKNFNFLKNYKKIIYKELYPNIDLEYTIHPDGGIKYNLILHPGADASKIKMSYSKANTNAAKEDVSYGVDNNMDFHIKASLGQIIEKKPYTYYEGSKKEIESKFSYTNNVLTFDIVNYDVNKTIVIDPWIWASDFSLSTATREVECDGSGNSYVIGGEDNMQLKKFNSTGALLWTYNTPWDTIDGGWLGTLATDFGGDSYITMGTSPEIQKVNNAGGLVWGNTGGSMDEYWSITFNCDKTRLIIGGTHLVFGLPIDAYARIFEIDVNSGNVSTTFDAHHGVSSGLGGTPIEVRSISASRSAKYAFLTHEQVGIINQNLGACPTMLPTFSVDNQAHLGYKCETFLGIEQNGGGLKAIIANDDFIFTHLGNEIKKWDINTGVLLASASIPGGSSSTSLGLKIVDNTGLAVDDNNFIYVGSGDRVLKYDENLNIIQQINTNSGFTVYDVSVSSDGKLVACGAVHDASNSTNRLGKVESFDITAGPQYALICCDVNICPIDPVCNTDPAFNITVSSPGGTFSGTGITNASSGTFDPAVAGPGVHTITYSKPCGSEVVNITVLDCNIDFCSDGTTFTAIGGNGTYTWNEWGTVTITITDQATCTSCGGSWNPGFPPFIAASCDISSCSSPGWVQVGTGSSVNISAINNWPVQLIDGAGADVTYNSIGAVPSCSNCTQPTVVATPTAVTCNNGSDGAINTTITGPHTYSISWTGPSSFSSTSVNLVGLSSGTYFYTVTDNTDNTCQRTGSVSVANGTSPTASISGNADICNGATSNVQITFTGSPNWSYVYSLNGINQPAVSGIATSPQSISSSGGTYALVSVTDGHGCTGTVSGSATVTAHSPVVVSNIQTACNGTANYTVTFDISNGDASSYVVTPSGSGALSGGTFTSNPVNSGTAYNFSVTDQYACTPQAVSGTVDCSCPVTASISGNASICNGASANVSVAVSGGSFPYTVVYSDGSSHHTINNVMSSPHVIPVSPTLNTSYTLISVSDATCSGSVSGSATVTVNPIPSVTISSTASICAGQSAQFNFVMTGTPNYTIVYHDGISNQTISSITSSPYQLTINPTTSVTYTLVSVQDANCSSVASGSSTVTVNPTPNVNAGNDVSLCTGDQVTLSATGASSYLWNNGVVNGMSFTPSSSATYTVTGTDANGCVNTDQVSVTVSSTPVISAGNDQSICLGQSASLNVVNSGSILWSTGETTSNIIVTPNYNTSYSVTVTNGSCSGTDEVNVNVLSSPVANAGNDVSICFGDYAVVTASGSGTYTWSHGLGNSPQINVSPSTTTTYTVTVANSIGCSSTDDIIVSVFPVQNITINPTYTQICEGQSAILTASGADTYTWFPTYGLSSNVGASVIASPSVSTQYSVIGVYGPGCESTILVQVDVDRVEAAFQIPDYACQSDTVILSPTVTSGIAPYSYVWQGSGHTGSSFQVIAHQNNTYSVIVTDAIGCYTTASVTLFVYDSLRLNAYSNLDTVCQGDTVLMNAAIWSGTGVPYTLWIDNVYSNTIKRFVINQDHDYIFTAEDGCMQVSDTVKMRLHPMPFVDFMVDKNVVCEEESIKFTSTILPLSLASNYIWNFGDSDAHNLSLYPNPNHKYEQNGLYDVSLEVLTNDGCVIKTVKSQYIRVNDNPIAIFKPTPPVTSIIKPEIYFENMSIGASSYYWNFYTGDESNLMNPIYSYQNIGNYEVMLIAYSEFGCPDTAYGNIKIEPVIEIWFPTAFSPDGDNLNDYFGPKGINILEKDFEMTIYDRWGEPIFTTNDLYLGWDGRAKNNEYVQVGVYKYIAKFKDAYDITHEASGSVNVIR